tara:strand:- start:754 stop:948 length:195 start_codon:yes stop_codon:yes gene_type:complete
MFQHLKEQKLTYWYHFKQAISYYTKIQKAALCVFLHAFWPDLFPCTASNIIKDLAKHFEQPCED